MINGRPIGPIRILSGSGVVVKCKTFTTKGPEKIGKTSSGKISADTRKGKTNFAFDHRILLLSARRWVVSKKPIVITNTYE